MAAADRRAALLCGVGQAYRPRWIIIAGFLMMLVVGLLAFAALPQLAATSPLTSAAAGKVWTAAPQRVRTPLGEMLSRAFLAQENLPASPAGYDVLKLRTRFANKADALDAATLARMARDRRDDRVSGANVKVRRVQTLLTFGPLILGGDQTSQGWGLPPGLPTSTVASAALPLSV